MNWELSIGHGNLWKRIFYHVDAFCWKILKAEKPHRCFGNSHVHHLHSLLEALSDTDEEMFYFTVSHSIGQYDGSSNPYKSIVGVSKVRTIQINLAGHQFLHESCRFLTVLRAKHRQSWWRWLLFSDVPKCPLRGVQELSFTFCLYK